MTLENYLSELTDKPDPINHSGLLQLSSLSNPEILELVTVWPRIPLERRREMLERMIELASDNLELDFASVFKACLIDPDDQVRVRAARGLWDCDDRTLIRPLIQLLKVDPSAEVRAAAAVSLGKFAVMAQDRKILPRDAEKIHDALLAAVNKSEEDLEVERRSIEAIASFSSPQVEDLIRNAYHDGDAKLKQSAIYAMGRSSDERWLPIVIQETRHQDASIRYEAANACGNLGSDITVPHIIAMLEDEDSQVQLVAVKALGTIGGGLAKRALKQCLKMGDEAMEEAATAALESTEFDEDPLGFTFES